MFFRVEWRQSVEKCEKTQLHRVGGLDEQWSASAPFVHVGTIIASNYVFAPNPEDDQTECVLECRPK